MPPACMQIGKWFLRTEACIHIALLSLARQRASLPEECSQVCAIWLEKHCMHATGR